MGVIRGLNTLIFLILIFLVAYARYFTDFFIESQVLLDALLNSLIVILLAYTANSLAGDFIRRKVSDTKDRYTFRKTVSTLLSLFAFAALFAIWFEETATLVIAYGILSAGVAIALQDLLKSVAGGIIIFVSRPFKAGDRIQVGDCIGDVLDIGNFSTKLMEIREWVDADQYTGRIIQLPNSFVLSENIKNYTRDFSFIWDEIKIMLIYGSNWKKAEEIALKISGPVIGEFEALARKELQRMGEKYFITTYDVQTKLYTKIEENWIEMRLRYVVEPRKRRAVSHLLISNLLQAFEQEEDIMVGTASSIDILDSSHITVERK
ncbi:mechanosensitive ion channel [Methanosarcina sp. KYL-1]|uniref:mechanosensitive ion channel family protein n=1 Tax=Methanosarcina sp. KYL-1 TaxID=2602068 RepID=UPI0021006DBA|nr:mechanosensitive ion channel domain-containing protein [Methanosarcina sp. KYL-1]MCQ1534789.1 mechanosensitive ion channel [Methanosarcina sp. KYL-1]